MVCKSVSSNPSLATYFSTDYSLQILRIQVAQLSATVESINTLGTGFLLRACPRTV